MLHVSAVTEMSEVFNIEPAGTNCCREFIAFFLALSLYWSLSVGLPDKDNKHALSLQAAWYMFSVFSPVKPAFKLYYCPIFCPVRAHFVCSHRLRLGFGEMPLFLTPVVILLLSPVAVETCHIWDRRGWVAVWSSIVCFQLEEKDRHFTGHTPGRFICVLNIRIWERFWCESRGIN